MKLNKGLYTDNQPIDQPVNTWRNGRNLIVSKRFGAIYNEDGFFHIRHTNNNIGYPTDELRPIGFITLDNASTVVFSVAVNEGETISEIGVMREDDPRVGIVGYFLEQAIATTYSAGNGQTLFDGGLYYEIRIRPANNQPTDVNIQIPQGTVAVNQTITEDTTIGYTIPINKPSIQITNSNSGNPITVEIVANVAKYYDRIIRDNFLNFSFGYPVQGVFKKTFKGETVIAFTDRYNPPRVLNINNPGIPISLEGKLLDKTKADLLDLFVKVAVPSVEVLEVSDAGGQLTSGTYFASFAYELEDGGVSNTAIIANPVFITDDAKVDPVNQVDGTPAGVETAKSIRYKVTNVDERYTYIRLYMVSMIDQQVNADLVGRFRINGPTSIIEYTGTEVAENIPLDEVTVDKAVYSRIGTLTNYQNRLYAADLEIALLMDYQKYANNITTEWVFEDEIAVNEVAGSAKDSAFMFLEREYQDDEIYAFYITPILNSGIRAPGFHIPGRAASSGRYTEGGQLYTETQLVSELSGVDTYLQEDESIADNVRYFQTRDTSTVNVDQVSGKMSYWQNENEFYPAGTNSEIWEDAGDGTGRKKLTGETTLAGKNVRHHKFPTKKKLIQYHPETLYTDGNSSAGGTPIGNSTMQPSLVDDFITDQEELGNLQSRLQLRASVTDPLAGTLENLLASQTGFGSDIEDVIYVAVVDQALEITLPFMRVLGVITNTSGASQTILIKFEIKHLDASGGLIETLLSLTDNNSTYNVIEFPSGVDEVSTKPSNFEDPAANDPDPTSPEGTTGSVGSGSETNNTADEGTGAEQLAEQLYTKNDPQNPVQFGQISTIVEENQSISAAGDEIYTSNPIPSNVPTDDNNLGAHALAVPVQPRTITAELKAGEKIVFDVQITWGGSELTPADVAPSITDASYSQVPDAITIEASTITKKVSSSRRGKRLGVRFSNIFFPDELLDKIQGFEIAYARRTINNQTIIGQSILFPYKWESGSNFANLSAIERDYDYPWRWHGFDSMVAKSNLFPTHITQQCGLAEDFATPGQNEVRDYTGFNPGSTTINNQYYVVTDPEQYLRKVTNVKYLAPDNARTEPSNEKRELCMFGEMGTNLVAPISGSDGRENPYWLSSAVAYKKNVYQSVEEQELVSTGRVWRTTKGINTYATGNVYGGDTFQAVRGLVTFAADGVGNAGDDAYDCHLFLQKTAMNPGMRHEGEEWNEFYYPKTDLANPTNRVNQIPNGTPDPEDPNQLLGPDDGAPIADRLYYLKSFSEHYGYNNDYTAINQYAKSIPYTGAPFISNFPTRIARSEVSPSVDTEESWRNFLVLDVFDQERKRGAIHHLETFKDQLIIHHLRGTYVTRGTQRIKTDIASAYLGTGDIFDNKPVELITTKEGYAGCNSSWACILTKAGYFFIDAKQGRVFLLNEKLDEISNKGMREFFRNKLPGSRNNPFFADGYIAAYDDQYNRVLLTKRGNSPFTISYSFDTESWVSFHDYLPSAIWSTRNKIYSYKHNPGETGVRGWLVQHNDNRVKGIYYDINTQYPTYIEPVFTFGEKGLQWWTLKWLTEVLDVNTTNQYNKTLTGIIVYTHRQCSGEVNLTPLVNVRRTKSEWFTKNFRDIVKDKSLPFFDSSGQLITDNLAPNATYWKKRRFEDNYLIVRFIYDNVGDDNLYLYSVDAEARKQIR